MQVSERRRIDTREHARGGEHTRARVRREHERPHRDACEREGAQERDQESTSMSKRESTGHIFDNAQTVLDSVRLQLFLHSLLVLHQR